MYAAARCHRDSRRDGRRYDYFMDIRTESPFFLAKNGLMKVYPSLRGDLSTDYAIIGGGITGALIAWYLAKAGVKTAVFDRRHIGTGSTCASTALLQYEIDTPLCELADMIGEKDAARSYQLCVEAIDKLEEIAKGLPIDCEFERKPSFYYASRKKDVADLKEEYEIRRRNGLNVELWNEKDVAERFPFRAPAAIFSPKNGGQVDAYRLTHALLQDAIEAGAKVFDKTEIKNIEHLSRSVRLTTTENSVITAKKIVIACGYESVNYLPRQFVRLHSTYAQASEPLPNREIWYKNCLIWETARPYFYLRTTADNRIIVGGKDEVFYSPKKRDKLLTRKTREIADSFRKKFPEIDFRTDYNWAGTFGETADGLPYIGSIKQLPHTIFALGFGGNGITFSQIAAEILRDEATGKKNSDARIFSFDRAK
jgi:glycine/D-amino acid oxidase-like deaminating enzyme